MIPRKLILIISFLLALVPRQPLHAQWVQANEVDGNDVPAFAVSGSNLFAIIGFGVGCSTDNGTTWTDVSTALFSTGKADGGITGIATNETDLFAGTEGGLFRSTDEGTSWDFIGSVLRGDSAITELVFAGTNFFARTYSGIFRSSDSGKSWSLASNGLPKDTAVTALAALETNLFAGTPYGALFRSTDSGNHWSSANAGIPDTASVGAFASIGNNIFACTGRGVYRSTDQGDTWINVGNFLSQCIAVSGSNLFAGLDEVYLSTDSGTSWSKTEYNEGMFALAVNQSYVFTGTYDAGVWRRPLSDFGISAVSQTPPVSNTLRSYPNPFSQSTQITFTSQAAGYADVSVVNILGAPVAHLFSGELAAGEHDFAWDAGTFSPGSYWCVVCMGGSVERIALSVER